MWSSSGANYLLHLLLQVSDPGLPAVLPDEQAEGLGRDGSLLLSQAAERTQLRHQVPLETQREGGESSRGEVKDIGSPTIKEE